MSIIRLGRFVPTSLREWDAVFRGLNGVINEDAAGNVTVDATVPAQDAAYVTVGANDTLPNERVLTGGRIPRIEIRLQLLTAKLAVVQMKQSQDRFHDPFQSA